MPDWRYYPIDEIPAGLSLGEWICQDFTRYLNLLCMRKQCFFLPVELQRLRMQDVGGRHEFVTRFDTYNAVVGLCGTGKTALVRSLACLFGLEVWPQSNSHVRNESFIELDVAGCSSFHLKMERCEGGSWASYKPFKSLVIDDPCRELTNEGYRDFLLYLRGFGIQIVITMSTNEDERFEIVSSVFPDCNIIRLQRGD